MNIQSQPLFHKVTKDTELTITQSGFVTTDSTWNQKPLYALESRLYFVTDGSGMLLSDTEEMPLEAGYVYLAPCGTKCGFYGTDKVTKLYFHINLRSVANGSDVFSNLTRFVRLPYPTEKTEALKALYLSTDSLDHIQLKSELYRVIGEFIMLEKEHFLKGDRYSRHVTDAIAYINSHLHARLTVGEIAEASFCSRSKLTSLFKAEVGQSVTDYLNDLLMSEAKNMLHYSDRSIAKISERLGFCDQFYFSRVFRKHFGVSPINYRKNEK